MNAKQIFASAFLGAMGLLVVALIVAWVVFYPAWALGSIGAFVIVMGLCCIADWAVRVLEES